MPIPQDWAAQELPDTWIDAIAGAPRPWRWWMLAINFLRASRQRVCLPETLPGREEIPLYVLQSFHHLPNGNYSKRVSRGYIAGFDVVMLGEMKRARAYLARQFGQGKNLIDMGCGGGRMAARLQQVSGGKVWGLDPSPYLLQHAAETYPQIHFLQGVAEKTGFPAGYFDGATACFLFHEMPPKYGKQALREIHRILKPGALLAICEPSRVQYQESWFSLFRIYGWKGIYFHILASMIHEPFLDAWHRFCKPEIFTEAGFEIVRINEQMPVSYFFVRKPLE